MYTDYTKVKSKTPTAFEEVYNNVMRFFPKSQLYTDIGQMQREMAANKGRQTSSQMNEVSGETPVKEIPGVHGFIPAAAKGYEDIGAKLHHAMDEQNPNYK